MKRYRPLLSVLLGLMLLVQGFAVSAAPKAKWPDAAHVQNAAQAEMPCHAQKAVKVKSEQTSKSDRSCCNAGCPDMSTCALGHFTIASKLSVVLPNADRAMPSFTPVRIVVRAPTSLLRPPSLQG